MGVIFSRRISAQLEVAIMSGLGCGHPGLSRPPAGESRQTRSRGKRAADSTVAVIDRPVTNVKQFRVKSAEARRLQHTVVVWQEGPGGWGLLGKPV